MSADALIAETQNILDPMNTLVQEFDSELFYTEPTAAQVSVKTTPAEDVDFDAILAEMTTNEVALQVKKSQWMI